MEVTASARVRILPARRRSIGACASGCIESAADVIALRFADQGSSSALQAFGRRLTVPRPALPRQLPGSLDRICIPSHLGGSKKAGSGPPVPGRPLEGGPERRFGLVHPDDGMGGKPVLEFGRIAKQSYGHGAIFGGLRRSLVQDPGRDGRHVGGWGRRHPSEPWLEAGTPLDPQGPLRSG
jgi:hypothetical protein